MNGLDKLISEFPHMAYLRDIMGKYELSKTCCDGTPIDPDKYEIEDHGNAWGRHRRVLKQEFYSDESLPHVIGCSGSMTWNNGWERDNGNSPCSICLVDTGYTCSDAGPMPYLRLQYRRFMPEIRDKRVVWRSHLVKTERKEISKKTLTVSELSETVLSVIET